MANCRQCADLCDKWEAEEKRAKKYKLALELALVRLRHFEPGDSRSVSDEFVAMAAILSDANTADDCVELVRLALIRETGQ